MPVFGSHGSPVASLNQHASDIARIPMSARCWCKQASEQLTAIHKDDNAPNTANGAKHLIINANISHLGATDLFLSPPYAGETDG